VKLHELVAIIERDGWQAVRRRGSHRIYRHQVKTGIVMVPVGKAGKEVPVGTAKSVLKQAGLE
jgi:predicted RNA binding protein YcfA (HicA-like mRNA interferase family)